MKKLLGALVLALPAHADTINVPGDQPTIQAGINAAANGDTILVAPGKYYENISFGGFGGVYHLASSDGPAETSIVASPFSTESVVTLAAPSGGHSGSSIDGFTILDGSVSSFGGGLHISQGQLGIEVSNCIFQYNSAFDGGGAYVDSDSTASFIDCVFIGNTATNDGGGLCIDASGGSTVDRCRFESNSATNGGGALIGNGAMLANDEAFPLATNCVFYNNTATGNGGGLRIVRAIAWSPVPTAPIYVGGVFGSTFVGNTAASGGSMYGGSHETSGLDQGLRVANCIVWENEGLYTSTWSFSTWPNFSHCCLDLFSSSSSSSNTSIDPRLFDAANGDVRLLAGSPCIDAGLVYTGDSTVLNGAFDIVGANRRIECTLVEDSGTGPPPLCDMGAYEFDEDDIDGSVAIPDPDDPSGSSIDDPDDWWDAVLPDHTIPTWLDGDVPTNISVGGSSVIGTTYVNSGEFTFSHANGSSTPTLSVAEFDGHGKAPAAVYVGAFEGEFPTFSLSNVSLACDSLVVARGMMTLESGPATVGPSINTNSVVIASSGPTAAAVLMGTGTIVQTSPTPFPFVWNLGVLQPTGPIAITGDYYQSGGVLFPDIVGMLRFDLTSLDQSLIVTGSASLGGAVHFALDPENQPDLNVDDFVVLLTATDGFVDDSSFDYSITSGFDGGKFFTLSHNSSATAGSTVTGTVVSADEILFGDGETDTSDLVADSLLADMDGDGFQDLVLSVPSLNSIVILLNEGTTGGVWDGFNAYGSATIVFVVGENPTGLDSGDFDGDGLVDLVVANTGDGTVSILLNELTLPSLFDEVNFSSAPHLPLLEQSLAQPLDVFTGDLDGDGDVDLAVTNAFDGTVVAFENEGTWFGGFGGMGGGDDSNPGATIEKFDPNGAAGKGRDDQVWGSSSSDGSAKTGQNTGSGVGPGIFLEWNSYPTDHDPVDIGVGDLNGDGDQDVVTVNESTGTISVLLGDDAGGQHAANVFAIGTAPRSVDLGDLDGDGDLDIAVVCENDSAERVVRVIMNTLDEIGVFGLVIQPDDLLAGQQPFLVTIGDVDLDGSGDGAVDVDDVLAITSSTGFLDGHDGFVTALGELERRGSCPADLSGNGMVDGADIGLVLAGWGTDGPSDINGNGVTDGADMGLLLAAWGPCDGAT